MVHQLCNLLDHSEPVQGLVFLLDSCIAKLHCEVSEVYQSIRSLRDSGSTLCQKC